MDDEKLQQFVSELTALSHKYGLGITDEPHLFVLESDDASRRYSCDQESRLHFE